MINLERVGVALLSIGGIFTMNIQEAVHAADKIKPKVTIPMHNMKVSFNEFKQKAETIGIKVKILGLGEIFNTNNKRQVLDQHTIYARYFTI